MNHIRDPKPADSNCENLKYIDNKIRSDKRLLKLNTNTYELG